MAKFLDLTGLTQFKNKLQEWANATFVASTRTINGKALSSDVTLSADDVQAIPVAQKGVASGVASLDENGKVPSAQLPSYVDDVIEVDNYDALPETGESGKIYMTKDTNKAYRWGGSAYVEIAQGVTLGETASTAYPGDKGKIAYDHAQLVSGNPHNVTKADVDLANVENVKQIAGLAEGTTEDHVVTFGADGFSVKDSGFTIASNVPADAKFTDTTYSDMVGATGEAGGTAGLVPAPSAGQEDAFLRGDGTWVDVTIPTKVSDLTNDSGYQTASDVEGILTDKGYLTEIPEEYVTDTELTEKGYQTASQVNKAIATATADFITADDLPTAITEEEIDGLFA